MANRTLIADLEFIRREGETHKQSKWCLNNPLMKLINHDFVEHLDAFLNEYVDCYSQFKVSVKSGSSGSWSKVVYIAFLDKKISRSLTGYTPSLGIYPIILISPDCKHFYFAYMVAVGLKTEKELNKIVSNIRDKMEFPGYSLDTSSMELGEDKHNYRVATICFKELIPEQYTSDEQLGDEIKALFEIHNRFIETGIPYTIRL